jgi:hypothetical protein
VSFQGLCGEMLLGAKNERTMHVDALMETSRDRGSIPRASIHCVEAGLSVRAWRVEAISSPHAVGPATSGFVRRQVNEDPTPHERPQGRSWGYPRVPSPHIPSPTCVQQQHPAHAPSKHSPSPSPPNTATWMALYAAHLRLVCLMPDKSAMPVALSQACSLQRTWK